MEHFVIAFAPGHEFEKLNAVRLRDLHQKLYLSRMNCEFGEHMLELYRQNGVEPIRPYRSERDDWIQGMVVTIFPGRVTLSVPVTTPGLQPRPLIEPEVVRTVSLVTVRGRPHSPAVGAFVRTARGEDWGSDAIH